MQFNSFVHCSKVQYEEASNVDIFDAQAGRGVGGKMMSSYTIKRLNTVIISHHTRMRCYLCTMNRTNG